MVQPVLIAGLLWTALGAQAATYTVTSAVEAPSLTSKQCDSSNSCPTLRDAINAALANTHDASNTIQFDHSLSGKTINLTQYSNDTGNPNNGEFGPSAFYLPSSLTPSSTLTIDATLNGVTSPITVQRDPSADKFRLFDVGVNATLTLRGLVLANGVAQGGNSEIGGAALGAGGAVFSQGTVLLDRCLVSGNQALGGEGTSTFQMASAAGASAAVLTVQETVVGRTAALLALITIQVTAASAAAEAAEAAAAPADSAAAAAKASASASAKAAMVTAASGQVMQASIIPAARVWAAACSTMRAA